VYDGDGNRVAKVVGGVTTRYLVDDLNPTGYLQVLEEVSGSSVQSLFTYSDVLVSQTRNPGAGPQTSYYGYDSHGNVTYLTDGSGAVTDTYDYDAWGNVVARTGTTPNTRTYAGEELDSAIGLFNLRARYYDAAVGRFMSIDPLVSIYPQRGAFSARHAYAENDPVNLFDPLGLMALEYKAVQDRAKRDTAWVYKFVHKGMCYIGITVDIGTRSSAHKRRLDDQMIQLEKLFGDLPPAFAKKVEQSVINWFVDKGLLFSKRGAPITAAANTLVNKINSVAGFTMMWDELELTANAAAAGKTMEEVAEAIRKCIQKKGL
jgi:RHS repeat-associated protein